MSKYCNVVTKMEWLSTKDKDSSYHCSCKYCTEGKFLGEIFNVEQNKYYSQNARKSYYPKADNVNFPHNNPGQWAGYRFAIQNLTNPGDIVFDPTVGTGTAIVEAENNERIGIGVELEFPETTKYFCEGRGEIHSANALEIDPETIFKNRKAKLIINGTPYPSLASISSDAPYVGKEQNHYGDYRDVNNIGKWKEELYKKEIHSLYTRFIPYLEDGGFLCIIIKDPTQKFEPYNLHKIIVDSILKHNPNMNHYGSFIHRHIPTTFFMNTYETITGRKLKVYHQTGIVLQKSFK